jgi:hypothetical protein
MLQGPGAPLYYAYSGGSGRRIHRFPGDMFAFCNLPELRVLKVEITRRNTSQRKLIRRSYRIFMSFGHLTTRIPILPRKIAERFTVLYLEFNGWTVKDSSRFFELFGVRNWPGVLRVLGDDLKLKRLALEPYSN